MNRILLFSLFSVAAVFATTPASAQWTAAKDALVAMGHRLNDAMWPWVGNAPGYQTVSVTAAVRNRLPDYSSDPAVTVSQMLDFEAMGFTYADPV